MAKEKWFEFTDSIEFESHGLDWLRAGAPVAIGPGSDKLNIPETKYKIPIPKVVSDVRGAWRKKWNDILKTPQGQYIGKPKEELGGVTQAWADLEFFSTVGAVGSIGIDALSNFAKSPIGIQAISKVANSPLLKKLLNKTVSPEQVLSSYKRIQSNTATKADRTLFDSINKIGQFAKARTQGVSTPRFGQGPASLNQPGSITNFHAGVPIPFKPNDIVQAGKEVGRLLNITGNTAAIVNEFGKTVEVKVSELSKPTKKQARPFDPKILNEEFEKYKDLWIGDKDVRSLQTKIEKGKLQEDIKVALGKEKYDEEAQDIDKAIHLYIDNKRNPSDVAKYYDSLTEPQKRIVKISRLLETDPKVMEVVKKVEESYRQIGLEALEGDVIHNTLENYVSRVWKGLGEPKKGLPSNRKFSTTTRHAKQRTRQTIVEGLARGDTLRVEGATNNLQILKEEMVKTLGDKEFVNTLKDIKDIDGNPLLTTKHLPGYVRVEHPNFKTWKFVGKAPEEEASGKVYGQNFFRTEDGDLFERQELYAPKQQAENINTILGISKLKGIPVIDFLTKYNAVTKSWILQSSLFHHFAFGRSYWLGTNHKKWGELNLADAYKQGLQNIKEENPVIMLLVRNGLTFSLKQDWDEDLLREESMLDKFLDKNKVIGDVKNKILDLRRKHSDFLFGSLGAGLKAKAGMIEFRNQLAKYPNEDPNTIAKRVASLINDDFGGLHLQRLGRNPTLQHVFRLFALAPDWTESNIRTMIIALTPSKVTFKNGKFGITDKQLRDDRKREANIYRSFWTGIFTQGIAMTVLANILLHREDTKDTLTEAWGEGDDWKMLRWLGVDITPIYKMFGGTSDKRKYFSILGHFQDPLKFLIRPIKSAQHKGSRLVAFIIAAGLGEDWASRRFTGIKDLLGDKQTVKYDYGKKGPVKYDEIPSFLLSQIKGTAPVQVQQIYNWLVGEADGFDALLNSIGLGVRTTYESKKKKRNWLK